MKAAAFDTVSGSGFRHFSWLISFGFLLLIVGCGQFSTGQEPEPSPQKGALLASEERLDFGTIGQGGRTQISVQLRNLGSRAVEIGTVESSCDCFHVQLQTTVVQPGASIRAEAVLDLANDQDFVGKLSLSATGSLARSHRRAFIIEAEAEVKPRVSSRPIAK